MKKAVDRAPVLGISEVEEYIPRKDLKGRSLKVASVLVLEAGGRDREPLRGLSLRYLTPAT